MTDTLPDAGTGAANDDGNQLDQLTTNLAGVSIADEINNDAASEHSLIMRLPEETLFRIFELVEDLEIDNKTGVMTDRQDSTVADLQNCRLTCRLFSAIASELLIREVRVDVRLSSIDRLEEITQHPVFSKGVRAVRICYGYYNEKMSEDYEHFASVCPDHWPLLPSTRPDGEVLRNQMIETGQSWERASSSNPEDSSEVDKAHLVLLKMTHQRYRQLFAEQQRLGDKFSLVASLIAKLRNVREIRFDEKYFSRTNPAAMNQLSMQPWNGLTMKARGMPLNVIPCDGDENNAYPAIYKALLIPWDPETAGVQSRLNIDTFRVPIAIHLAGGRIDAIRIHAFFDDDLAPPKLVCPEDLRDEYRSVEQGLKSHALTTSTWDYDPKERRKICIERGLTNTATDALYVNLYPPDLARVPQLAQEARNLTTVHLDGMTSGPAMLVWFVCNLPSKMKSLTFRHIFLSHCSNWGTTIEALREKSYGHLCLENLGHEHDWSREHPPFLRMYEELRTERPHRSRPRNAIESYVLGGRDFFRSRDQMHVTWSPPLARVEEIESTAKHLQALLQLRGETDLAAVVERRTKAYAWDIRVPLLEQYKALLEKLQLSAADTQDQAEAFEPVEVQDQAESRDPVQDLESGWPRPKAEPWW
ncbi:hypothetical protein QBC34DRAFT_108995 [Podospora aff. communis PSN243]|uniref:F-box domain-containing protein n=1 Tax=Podospora aff. communis PSN243 TaxID=3040156 RepID=A0AAV9H3D8_9PEZI|nr:hypothetical protein QBC34DRAFT_108995 [Podospora aff. communis PSN243]